MDATDRGRTCDVLCVGLGFVDVNLADIPEGGPVLGREIWTPAYGVGPGGVANFALAVAALGGRARLASTVGGDVMGRLFVDECERAGIDCGDCVVVDEWRQPVTAAITYDGDRALVTGGTEPPIDIHAVLDERAPDCRSAIAHLGPRASQWIIRAADHGAKVVGQVGWDPTGEWDEDALDALRGCWAFLPNQDEALAYTRATTLAEAADLLAERVEVVVITRGAEGAHVRLADGTHLDVPGLPARLVDATGAGDMFGASFALAVGRGLDVLAAVELAMAVAALGVSRPGGASAAPTLDEAVGALRAAARPTDLVDRIVDVLGCRAPGSAPD